MLRTFLFLLVLVAPGWGLPVLLPVPDTRQSTVYSCGAAALQALLGYYGVDVREDVLMERLATSPKEGTRPEALVRVCSEYGLQAELRQNLSLDDLRAELEAGRPVIVDAQAWREGSELQQPWTAVWESGHYMVAIGLDESYLYLEDPSLLGSRGRIPWAEFNDRWHDYESGPQGERQEYDHAGILVRGKRPSPPPAVAPVGSARRERSGFLRWADRARWGSRRGGPDARWPGWRPGRPSELCWKRPPPPTPHTGQPLCSLVDQAVSSQIR